MKQKIRSLFLQGKSIKFICECLSTTEYNVSKTIDEVFSEYNTVRLDQLSEIRELENELWEAIITEKHNKSKANVMRTNNLMEKYVKYPNQIKL